MIKIGDKLGHFLIQAEIGRGGMGTIYQAVDTMLNREVALKAIHPQLADNQQLMDRFKIEAMTQARLNHPNIVTIFSFNKIDEQYIIAMEYVEGKSVKELLHLKKKLTPAEAIAIITQVAEGLGYAHAHNVIHRDIKPANILLGKDNQVKISDFGIAKIFGSQGLTKTGMLIGTPWYTPPEQILGKTIDFRADLYSLGVTFYELLTGRVPFDSETNSEFQIQKAHLETPPPRPSIYNPKIDAKLEKIILQALQKKVEKRFQNARDLILELQAIRRDRTQTAAVDLAPVHHAPGFEQPPVKRRSSRFSPLPVLAFLILALAGVIAWITFFGPAKSGIQGGPGGSSQTSPPPPAITEPDPLGEKTQAHPLQVNVDTNGTAKTLTPAAGDPLPMGSASQDRGEAGNVPPAGEIELPGKQGTSGKAEAEAGKKVSAADVATVEKKQPTVVMDAGKSEKESATPPQAKDNAEPVKKQVPPALELGSLDAEMLRLRGYLEKKDLAAADRLADALFESGADSRVFPLLGNVKFLLNQFPAAEQFWLKALQANQLVTLELAHRHDGGDYCLGQLKFKRKILLFNSETRGDHSFALQGANIRLISLDRELKIIIAATIHGQEINESFTLVDENAKREKEKFLVAFLNNNVR